MLDMSFGLQEEATIVWAGLHSVFGNGYRTAELATQDTPKERIISTSKFGDLVEMHIKEAE